MRSMWIFKFGFLCLSLNTIILQANPIGENKELECSAQDDEILFDRKKRAALSLAKHPKWPNKVIHFFIDCPNFTNEELLLIKAALDGIEAKTCLEFVRIKAPGKIKDLIHVRCKPDGGCKSELGYQGRPQQLNLQVHRERRPEKGGCMTIHKIQHEFMHALGFRHEHNSPIRDKYVKIIKQNIAKGWDHYFDVDSPADYDNYGCPYDYESVMQVDSFRHSVSDNQPTIIPLNKRFSLETLGKSPSISSCDAERIRNMYCTSKRNGNNKG